MPCGYRIPILHERRDAPQNLVFLPGTRLALRDVHVSWNSITMAKKNTQLDRLKRTLQIAALGLVAAGTGCSGTNATPVVDASQEVPEGWGEESHSANAEPAYDRFFDDDVIAEMRVHRFDLILEQGTYDESMSDLTNLLGTCGGGGGPGGGGPGGGGPGSGGADDGSDPLWVPITVRHDGLEWTHVGMRYKGNSSLQGAWSSCIKKLSFRLDFDQFEQEFPEILDQRFFGFKKMTFSNGYKDSSLIRDKLGADIFRRAGIPAARGAFAAIYATIGDAAPVYFGLYAMVEDPSNRLLDSQFEDDGGNLYKPESAWGSNASAAVLATEFEKKTNEDEEDWSDITAALEALHDDSRQSDPAAWRASLEERLNVPGFVRWLAVNQAMVNWDTYGCMAHNYYVYADPSDPTAAAPNGRLTWFPWDLNESLLAAGRCNTSDAAGLIPDSSDIGSQWPLIRYILDDAEYAALYREELARAIAVGGGMDIEWLEERIAGYHALIAPYVVGPQAEELSGYSFLNNPQDFIGSSEALQSFAEGRAELVGEVLSF